MIEEVDLSKSPEPKRIISHEFDMQARTMSLCASEDSSPGADVVI